MENKSVVKNYIYNLIYQVLVIILPLITTPYLSRVLGSEGIGIYSYTLSIATYFILFGSLGIGMYCQREIAYVQNDIKKRSEIFWEVIILRFITISISSIMFYIVFCNDLAYGLYYKILLINLIATCFDISPFFQGIEDFKKVIFRNIIVKLISIICIFAFVKNSGHVWIYLLIYVLSISIGNISLWLYLPKYVKRINLKKINIIRHLKPTILLFIPQIAMEVYTVLDKTMIGALVTNKSEVGYYEQSQKIVKLILTIVTALGTVMLPRIANQFASGKQDEIKKSIMKSINFVYFLSIPMMFGMIAISDKFIPLFLGQGYDKSITITMVISPILLFIGLSNVTGMQYLLPLKKQKEFTISVIIGATINCILNYILIPKYMSIGASIATVIAEFMVVAIQVYFVRKEFNVKEIIKLIRNYTISGIIMFIIVYIVKLIKLSSIYIILLQTIIGICIYFLILYLLRDEFMFSITKKCKSLISRKKNKL